MGTSPPPAGLLGPRGRDVELGAVAAQGETPGSGQSAPDAVGIDFGQTRYTADGVSVGTVRGADEGGVSITTPDCLEALSVEHVHSGHEFGSAAR